MEYTETAAAISDCGTYRYALTRAWQHDYTDTLVWLMLNPSTADGEQDDPTIRRCVGFADRWGYGRLVVVNLFAFRATDPDDLSGTDDPVGPKNDRWIEREAKGRVVVCAWGSRSLTVGPACPGRLEYYHQRPMLVARILRDAGATMKCLGLTADSQPRHPLYVRGDTELIDFRGNKTGC